MKLQNYINLLLAVIIAALLFSCTGKPSQQQETPDVQSVETNPVEINNEAKTLLSTLNEMGDYVNGREFPSIIKPSSVYEELDGNNLIIDLRNNEAFSKGHIKNAVNIEFSELPHYFANEIKPLDYKKIIIVCYEGQISSYATSLLRLAGYGNVYSMKWGMSAWNNNFAKDWLAVISSDYENKLETTENEKAVAVDFPKLNSNGASGNEILKNRIDSLFAAGYSNVVITAKEVFENPGDYYTINYDRKDKYESGHIPGAIRYKPDGTLGIVAEMQTIPTNKKVVIYCNTGQNSGFVTAYLRLFGYDAKTLNFGNNSFMYNKMQKEESTLSWILFTDAEIENYPYESTAGKM